MAYYPDGGYTLMVGGVGSLGFLISPAETWTFDGSWTKQTLSGCSTTTQPSPRMDPAMAYDPASNRVLLFGGRGSSATPLNDTWAWDGCWHQLHANGETGAPTARYGAAITYNGTAGHAEVLLFGGITASGYTNDTLAWDDTASAGVGNWVTRASGGSSVIPSPRGAMRMAYDDALGESVLFGGTNGGSHALGDTYVWDGTSWHQLTGLPFYKDLPGVPDPARDWYGMAYDPVEQLVVLFGGTDDATSNATVWNDEWVFDGEGWTNYDDIALPSARMAIQIAFDPDPTREWMLTFGGVSAGARNNETWRASYTRVTVTDQILGEHPTSVYAAGEPVVFQVTVGNPNPEPEPLRVADRAQLHHHIAARFHHDGELGASRSRALDGRGSEQPGEDAPRCRGPDRL